MRRILLIPSAAEPGGRTKKPRVYAGGSAGRAGGLNGTRVRRQPRGFMTVVALFLVGLVAATLALLAAAAAADARRTRAVVTGAQLRQLLLAGGADAASRSGGWGASPPTASWSMAVPAELSGYSVGVQVRSTGDDAAEATVVAEGNGQQATQRLTWTRHEGRWELADVTLGGG